MPFKWDPVAERNLLLHAIAEMQGPVATIWPKVAEKLGGGLNANACRYHSLIHLHLIADRPLASCSNATANHLLTYLIVKSSTS